MCILYITDFLPKFIYSHIIHYVSKLHICCVVSIIMAICHNCIKSLQINCFYTSLLPIVSCYVSSFVSLFFSRVCWCCVVCASPLFLLIVTIFGDFADFAPPLTSEWDTLLWHVTPFCALLLHVTEILHVFAHTTCY